MDTSGKAAPFASACAAAAAGTLVIDNMYVGKTSGNCFKKDFVSDEGAGTPDASPDVAPTNKPDEPTPAPKKPSNPTAEPPGKCNKDVKPVCAKDENGDVTVFVNACQAKEQGATIMSNFIQGDDGKCVDKNGGGGGAAPSAPKKKPADDSADDADDN